MTQAWHTASIPNMKGGWPSLAKLLGDEKPAQAQSTEQMLVAMKAWAATTRH